MTSPTTDRTLKLFDDDTYAVIAYDRHDVMRVIEEAGMGEADPESEELFEIVPMDQPVSILVFKGTNKIAPIDEDYALTELRTRKAIEWIQLVGRCFLYTREG